MKLRFLLLAFTVSVLPMLRAEPARRISVRDGWFVVDGERFFVKGIGYELHGGPGELPNQRTFDPAIMEYDLALMKRAGFNTVRAWNAYSEPELELLKRHGMMVIQGSWFNVGQYLRDPTYAKRARERLADVVKASKRFDNILFYTIANEPHPNEIIEVGMEAYHRACQEMKAVARREDPACLVTYSHCSWIEFLDQSAWDVVFFNDYMYAPRTVSTALKFRGHVEWLRRMHAANKPFVLGEFGLSVSKSGQGNMGYGGNTLAEQRDGDLHMYQAMIDAGGQGGCLFMWKDGWWKHGNPTVHDDHAEEWYGVLGIDTLESDRRGTPRPVYDGFRQYNQLILTEPRQMVVYSGSVPVDAFVTEQVQSVRCRVDGGAWLELKTSSRSWRQASLTGLDSGKHALELEATLDLSDIKTIRRSVDFIVGNPERALPKLTVKTDSQTYRYGDTVSIEVKATKGNGDPMPGLTLVGTHQNHYAGSGGTFAGTSDARGIFRTSLPLFVKPTFITLAFGADTESHGLPHRLTEATIIEVKGLPQIDIEHAAQGKGRLIAGFEYGSKEALAHALGRVLGGGARYTVEPTPQAKQGKTALALHLVPETPRSWGYTEVFLDAPQDVSQAKALTCWVHGDGSGYTLKLMWIDRDNERWLDTPIKIDFQGWRRITIACRTPQRDLNDGIKDGDGRPNPDRVRGLAFAVEAQGRRPSTLLVDAFSAHE
jgi:hypothetical protein